jgi:LysR family glycine cleavage system transcriptional activator
MKYRLPPLNALRLFEAAARLHSFRSAADELGLTPSAVGHGVLGLEQWLGTTLFRRTPKGLALSRAGQRYYPIVCQALDLLSKGSEELGGHRKKHELAISAAPTFAARWLLPRLQDFRDRHPDIKVMLDTARGQSDLASGQADIAIRLGRGDWPDLAAELLMEEQLVPVCAPRLARRLSAPDRIDDAPLIHVNSASVDWDAWARITGRPAIDATKGLKFDTLEMAFEAACQGLGIALGRKPLVEPELRAGRLVEVCAAPVRSETGYWLLCPKRNEGSTAVRRFRDWIAAQARQADNGQEPSTRPPVRHRRGREAAR